MRERSYLLLGMAAIVALAVGIYFAVSKAMHVFLALNSDVAKAIVAAGAAILVAIISLILSKQYEQRATIQAEHRTKKIPIYEELIEFLFRVTFADKLAWIIHADA